MSNAIAIRTNSDKAKSLLFKTIVTARKVIKSTKDNTRALYTETKATTISAMNHKI